MRAGNALPILSHSAMFDLVLFGHEAFTRYYADWDANIEVLLDEAKRLIQRDPPLLTPEERRRYGLE